MKVAKVQITIQWNLARWFRAVRRVDRQMDRLREARDNAARDAEKLFEEFDKGPP